LARYDDSIGSDLIIGIADYEKARERLFCEGAPYLQSVSYEKYRVSPEEAQGEVNGGVFRVEVDWGGERVAFYRNGELLKEEGLKEGLRECRMAGYVQTRKSGQELEWKLREGMSTILE
jgi:hypothetical protein